MIRRGRLPAGRSHVCRRAGERAPQSPGRAAVADGGFWWDRPLREFARAVELDYQVCAEAPAVQQRARRQRATGDWWRNGSRWCVCLEGGWYAAFPRGGHLPLHWRRLLTWMLRAVRPRPAPDVREQMREWANELALRPDQDVPAAVLEDRLGSADTPVRWGPGRVVWLHVFSAPGASRRDGAGGDGGEEAEDLRAAVEQVARAFVGDGWIGWTEPVSGAFASALLYWRATPDDEDEPGDGDRPGGTGLQLYQPGSAGDADGRRDGIGKLLRVVEADVLVRCEASIGQPVNRACDLYRGVATAVAAWRCRQWSVRPPRVVWWGDDPLALLLQSVPAAVRELFRDTAAARAPGGRVALAPELVQVLHGLVAADLNVSEAARVLYLHRNTLINRIDRIRQQTGYDPQHFLDALVLWLANVLDRTSVKQ